MYNTGIYDNRYYSVPTSGIEYLNTKDTLAVPGIYGISGNWDAGDSGGKLYVGSSNDTRYRVVREHLHGLRRNSHFNDHLQHAFNKYTEKSLSLLLLERYSTSDLLEREQNWLDYYNNTNPNILFNFSKLADRPPPVPFEVLSEMRSKHFIVTYPDGTEELIKNLKRFCKYRNIYAQNMRKVALGILSHTHGYKCRLPEDKEQRYVSNRKKSKELIEKQCLRWLVTRPDGSSIEVSNLKEFSRNHGLTNTALYRVANGYNKHHKGYKCKKLVNSDPSRFAKKNKYVSQEQRYKTSERMSKKYKITFPDGRVEITNRISNFAKENNLHVGCLRAVATGRRKHHKRIKVEFYNE
jgi:hypothetical protein